MDGQEAKDEEEESLLVRGFSSLHLGSYRRNLSESGV